MTRNFGNDNRDDQRRSEQQAAARRRLHLRLVAMVLAVAIALLLPKIEKWLQPNPGPDQGREVAVTEDQTSSGIDLGGVKEITGTTPTDSDQSQADVPEPAESTAGNSSQSRSVPDSVAEAEAQPGELTEIRRHVFQSTAGLLYVPGSQQGHRLDHVMEHAEDDPDRPIHGVFEGDRATILANIDNAYSMALSGSSGVHEQQSNGRTVYTINLKRRIGYVGGQVGERKNYPSCQYLRLVLQNGNEVVTAYPTNQSK